MRDLKLETPRKTSAGTVASVKVLEEKFDIKGRVSIKVQAYDAAGAKLGHEQSFRGSASDPTDLAGSANNLVATHFGEVAAQ